MTSVNTPGVASSADRPPADARAPSGTVRVALFDLDHTLIPMDSDHAWGEFTVSRGWVDPVAFKSARTMLFTPTTRLERWMCMPMCVLPRLPFAAKVL